MCLSLSFPHLTSELCLNEISSNQSEQEQINAFFASEIPCFLFLVSRVL